ncbi:11515_t:CDS:2, partial [Gigaspora margarita]
EAIISAHKVKKNKKEQDKYQEFRKDITCYTCEEKGHISQNCMLEKITKKRSEGKGNISNYAENIPYEGENRLRDHKNIGLQPEEIERRHPTDRRDNTHKETQKKT